MVKKAKPKKRGVKPGTKRGSYRKINNINDPRIDALAQLSMVETLDAAITRLEVAVGNSTDRINSLVGKF